MTNLDGIILSHIQPETGITFKDFFVDRYRPTGPGWYIFGRNGTKYGRDANGKGLLIQLCARPDVPARRYKMWNEKVRRGWKTKKEAQAIADQLNAMAERGELPND